MRNVDIEVFCIAKTSVDRQEVKRWIDHLGATGYDIPSEEAVTNPALLVALAAKRCYLSFEPGTLNPNVTKVRKDITEYLDNVLKSSHGSVLEHACYSFAIEGVSRVFTGELNRHRAGVGISEGSMRYIRYQDIPWWMPPSIKLTFDEENLRQRVCEEIQDSYTRSGVVRDMDDQVILDKFTADERVAISVLNKKLASQHVFRDHMVMTEQNYAKLQDIWKEELAPESKFHAKKQVTSMMRRIIPMGVATGGVWTFNLRAIRHIIALRASEAAEEEIAYVFGKIAKFITEQEPALFGDFTQDENGFWRPRYVKV